jgi:hypothetical protein
LLSALFRAAEPHTRWPGKADSFINVDQNLRMAAQDESVAEADELTEVTVVADPAVLRRIAAHLLLSADEIERHGELFDHLHLRDEWSEWDEEDADIIVARPR